MMPRLAREGLAERKPAGVQPNAAQFSVADGQIDVARRGIRIRDLHLVEGSVACAWATASTRWARLVRSGRRGTLIRSPSSANFWEVLTSPIR